MTMKGTILILFTLVAVCYSLSKFELRKLLDEHKGYNNSRVIFSSEVINKGECAVRCDQLGDIHCKGFNIRENNNITICELSDHFPSDISRFTDGDDKYYDKKGLCNEMRVVAGLRETVDNNVIVTLVDDKRAVYRTTTSEPRLKALGSVEEVFAGFDKEVHGLLAGDFGNGKMYGIKTGDVFYCFEPANSALDQFDRCKMFNQLPVSSIFRDMDGIKYLIFDGKTAITQKEDYITIDSAPVAQQQGGDDSKVRVSCPDNDRYGYCIWRSVWQGASGGLYLSSSQIGLFYGSQFYMHDLDAEGMIAMHPMCKESVPNYLL